MPVVAVCPAGKLPLDIGVVCNNVGTAAAIANLLLTGEPLLSRIVTVTGSGVASHMNIEARIGTPISQLIDRAGGYVADRVQLVMGGPMMGFSLETDELPVVKATNCLLVTAKAENTHRQKHLPCIRCGRCLEACPMFLNPARLTQLIRAEHVEELERHHLTSCFECASCSFACPSRIPLVQWLRMGKAMLRKLQAAA